MSLLQKNSAAKLLQLLQRYRDEEGADEEQLEALFGRPPYWFEERTAPRYADFVVQWRDAQQREYMDLWEGAMAVRLPIAHNRQRTMEFPYEQQQLLLVQKGGGHTRSVVVRTAQTSEHHTATAWFEYSLA